jgi:hypothetical protein
MLKTVPFPPIANFWHRVRFTDLQPGCRCPDYAQAEWQAFWETHIEGDRLAQTHPDDAYLLCSLGACLAAEQDDIPAALQRTLRWFDHPEWREVDHVWQEAMLYNAAMYYLRLGDETNGFARLRELMARHRPRHLSPCRCVRILLRSYYNEQPPERPAPEEMVALTVALLETQKGTKRWQRYLLSGGITCGDVLNALGGPFPSEGDPGPSGTTAADSP